MSSRKRAASLAALSAAALVFVLASCAVTQTNNAAIYADQAKRIAQSCPAAGQAAAEATKASMDADAAYSSYSSAASEVRTLEERRAAAERALQDAEHELMLAQRALGGVQATR